MHVTFGLEAFIGGSFNGLQFQIGSPLIGTFFFVSGNLLEPFHCGTVISVWGCDKPFYCYTVAVRWAFSLIQIPAGAKRNASSHLIAITLKAFHN